MTLPASVESTTDVWGTLPPIPRLRDPQSEFSEQLPALHRRSAPR
jgi:hypothetical protein